MFEVFIQDPKPIIWKDSFIKTVGQTDAEALEHSYPDLLTYRAGMYKSLSDVVLPFTVARSNIDAEEFLSEISKRLS